MKIGFLGNANNYPFLLAHELRGQCEIVFFVDADPEHFLDRPENYFGKLIPYPYPPGFIEDRSIHKPAHTYFPRLFSRNVLKELNSCDAVVVNSYGHFYLPFLKKNIISISVFSGSDLDVTCNWEIKRAFIREETNPLVRLRKWLTLYYSHRILKRSIFRTNLVSYFPEGLYPDADRILNEFKKGKPFYRYEHMHLSVLGIDYIPPRNNRVIRIFNAARFVWKKPLPSYMTETDNKRNDVLIRGMAKFIQGANTPLDIHFVEKGVDVEATKELIRDLGMESYVTWHQNMPHAEFINMLADCDIITDGLNRHVIGGGAFGMLVGRPMIANAIPDVVKRITGVEPEICHAETEEDVYEWLKKLVLDQSFREEKGRASREYIMRHHNLADEAGFFLDFIKQNLHRGHQEYS